MGIGNRSLSRIVLKSGRATAPIAGIVVFQPDAEKSLQSHRDRVRAKVIKKVFSNNPLGRGSREVEESSQFQVGRKEIKQIEDYLREEALRDVLPRELPAEIKPDYFHFEEIEPTRETNQFLQFMDRSNGWGWERKIFEPGSNDRVYGFLWKLRDRHGNNYMDLEGSFVAGFDKETKQLCLRGYRYEKKPLHEGNIASESKRSIPPRNNRPLEQTLDRVIKTLPVSPRIPTALAEMFNDDSQQTSVRGNKPRHHGEHGPGQDRKPQREAREIQLRLKQNLNRVLREMKQEQHMTPEFYLREKDSTYAFGGGSYQESIEILGENNLRVSLEFDRRGRDEGVKTALLKIAGRTASGARDDVLATFTIGNSGNLSYSSSGNPRLNQLMRHSIANLYNADGADGAFLRDLRRACEV
jgi:hypothetical protein